MATDIYGAQKNIHGADEIVMSTGVLVSIKDTVHLAQSVNLNYARQIQPVYELGSEDIWLTLSPASGTCEVSRAVSKDQKAFANVHGEECSKGYDISIDKGQGSCTADPGSIHASGCFTQSVGLQAQAGPGFLTEQMSVFVGCLEGK